METISLAQGDIILVPFPFSDQSGTKVRPALIISDDDFNRGDDIIIAAVTSNTHPGTYTIILDNDSLLHGFLHTHSAVKIGKLATIEKSLALKHIATLTPTALENVLGVVERVFGR